MKRIVIVTTGQPSTNPRAVKEATALASAGFDVHFLYGFWVDWASPFDDEVIKANPGIHWKLVGGSPVQHRLLWLYSRLRHKLFRWLSRRKSNLWIAKNAVSRSAPFLTRAAANIKADLYIAHNLGALPAAAFASRKHGSKYAFDAEDYHRGQEKPGSVEEFRMITLEESFIPGTCYLSAASPLIAEKYHYHFNKPRMVVNNVFSKKFLSASVNKPSFPLKLFWFSQTIGKGRGIEDVIAALRDMPSSSFTLTLLGKLNSEVEQYFLQLAANDKIKINFLSPVSTEQLFSIAAQHDVGLALEQPVELNRDLCLTNKIFTYLLAGNAIIFSRTTAQENFFNEYQGIGDIYDFENIPALKEILLRRLNFSETYQMKLNARSLAERRLNWEEESEIVINTVKRELF